MALSQTAARPAGRHVNTGESFSLVPLDIGHAHSMALVDPDTAFWALVAKSDLGAVLGGGELLSAYRDKAGRFAQEMETLRHGLAPSAVYLNPTQRCNLDCPYCYLPGEERLRGVDMDADTLVRALTVLREHFRTTLPEGRLPQVVFHGAEPLLVREALFAAIDRFRDDFRFGVQTNATLLDQEAAQFLMDREVSVGLSLDGPSLAVSDRTRVTRAGQGASRGALAALESLAGYPGLSVITTITAENVRHLGETVRFLHGRGVGACLINMVRCTRQGARDVRPDEDLAAREFLSALTLSRELHQRTGRKLVVGNFANVLLAILAPTARRLMCDISPCGGGRCFFAVAATGDVFPCGEFLGLPEFSGGNLFTDPLPQILASPGFARVTTRRIEDIEPCRRCAVRHFCGAPCPAEAHEMRGGMQEPGAFCRFYEEQTRFALRVIADDQQDDYLFDGWDEGVETVFDLRLV